MSKYVLREYYELCADGVCMDVLNEEEKRKAANGVVYLSGKLQEADCRNGNGRKYPQVILEREVKNYQNLINDRRALGELDHPDDSVINLKNVSHVVTSVWWNGPDVMGKIEVLNTPSGKVLQELINANIKIGISSRGLGSVRQQGQDTIVEDDFQLICFDIVSEPSTPNAFMLKEWKQRGSENNAISKINKALDDILG
ncbi:hypothetical protein OAT10_00365 [Luminiphilus sp.]|nr:hypothetical protein [Luminiphilus sp.]